MDKNTISLVLKSEKNVILLATELKSHNKRTIYDMKMYVINCNDSLLKSVINENRRISFLLVGEKKKT